MLEKLNSPFQEEAGFDEERFEQLLSEVSARRTEFQKNRQVSADIIAELKAVGLYRAFVPLQFGGSGMSASRFLSLIERIAAADGSVGWVASFAFATKYLSALPAETLAEIYKDGPDVVFAGAVFPPQVATKVDGGVRVSGRWGFASGCTGADLIGVGIKIENGPKASLPLMAVMPAHKATIDPVWDTIGMTGTGSHDVIVDDVFVPDRYIFERGKEATIASTAYAYPTLSMSAQVLAICGFGTGRAALDQVIAMANKTQSITGAPALGDRPTVQLHIGECEAKLRSAKAWFYEATDRVWGSLRNGETIERCDETELRLAASHIARTGTEVARACFEMTGTAGIFRKNPLSTHLTDSMVTAQHAFLNEGTFMLAGQAILGHPPVSGYP